MVFIIEELLKKAKSGDEESINEIIKKFTCFIIKQASKYKIPSFDFEDLLQHGCLSVIKAIKLYKMGNGSFTTYCTNSIVNNFNALLKGNIKHYREIQDQGILSIQPYDFTLEDEVIAYDEACKVNNAVDKLLPIEKSVIRSVYIQGRTLKKTAEMLGLNYRHAIKIKRESLNKLRKYLK